MLQYKKNIDIMIQQRMDTLKDEIIKQEKELKTLDNKEEKEEKNATICKLYDELNQLYDLQYININILNQ